MLTGLKIYISLFGNNFHLLSELQKLLCVIAAMHTTVVQIRFHRANTEV